MQLKILYPAAGGKWFTIRFWFYFDRRSLSEGGFFL